MENDLSILIVQNEEFAVLTVLSFLWEFFSLLTSHRKVFINFLKGNSSIQESERSSLTHPILDCALYLKYFPI